MDEVQKLRDVGIIGWPHASGECARIDESLAFHLSTLNPKLSTLFRGLARILHAGHEISVQGADTA